MVALAVQERQFLASVKHPNIVGVYTFIKHGGEGFIVMEYVNGKTLLTLRKEQGAPLPVPEAIAYILNLLPAFGYLDTRGLVYCDFKLENAMVEGDTVKLIDLGAVRRVDDTGGDVYGSKGYTAPEAADDPTPVSDLYSVARALAVLVAEFDFQQRYEYSLPPLTDMVVPESLYRFLQKSTAEAPDARFQTADDMGQQLLGILHEVQAGTPTGSDLGRFLSTVFADDADLSAGFEIAADAEPTLATLPSIRIDPADAGAAAVLSAAALPDTGRRRDAYVRALSNTPSSAELHCRLADALIAEGAYAEAEQQLATVAQQDAYDWRIAWYRGQLRLGQQRAREAIDQFDIVLSELPGELAPKMALGIACELGDDLAAASHYYTIVARTDPAWAGAAFGVARCAQKQGMVDAAADAYGAVPQSSLRYGAARLALARLLLTGGTRQGRAAEIDRAGEVVGELNGLLSGEAYHGVRADLYRVGAESVETHAIGADPHDQLLGIPRTSVNLRLAAERELRTCARLASDRRQRVAFVDRANTVRPRTVV